MRAVITTVLAAVIGLALYWFGYASATAVDTFGISDAIVGALVGGFLTTISGVAVSVIARDSTLESIKLSHRFESERLRENREVEAAKEILVIIGRVEQGLSEIGQSAGSMHLNRVLPDTRVVDGPRRELTSAVTGSFPQLNSFVLRYAMKVQECIGAMIGHFDDAMQGNEIPRHELIGFTIPPAVYASELQSYLASRFIERKEVDLPSVGEAELILARMIEMRQARGAVN